MPMDVSTRIAQVPSVGLRTSRIAQLGTITVCNALATATVPVHRLHVPIQAARAMYGGAIHRFSSIRWVKAFT
jgi:hypothetical protein